MTQSTAPTSCPALPPGADHASDDWETYDGVTQRLVWPTPMALPDHLSSYDIRVVVTQIADGTLVNNHGDDQPLVYFCAEDYLPADARLIAQALIGAADLADVWGGVPAAGRSDGDLLDDVPLPPGVTAGRWEIDAQGHLYRELSDGRRQRGYGDIYTDSSTTTGATQLDVAKTVLLGVYEMVKTLPGNAGDYVRGALDSISDAQEVLR